MPFIFNLLQLKQRLALWFLGQALPRPEHLQNHLRRLLLGIGAAAFAGVFAALTVAAGIYGVYLLLTTNGIAVSSAIGVVIILIAIILWGIIEAARHSLDAICNFAEELELQPKVGFDSLLDNVQEIGQQFFAGLREPVTQPSKDLPKVEDTITPLSSTEKIKA
jgi:amino acid transporter